MRRRSGRAGRWTLVASIAIVAVVASSGAAASGGSILWTRRYDGPAGGFQSPSAIAASPDGTKVFVTGVSSGNDYDYATVAYDASTGHKIWTRLYDGPASGRDSANDIAASPDGTKVFVTGASRGKGSEDYATIAYDASTGATLWVRRYRGPAGGRDIGEGVAVSPDGARVFVTGTSAGISNDYVTVAYDPSTGMRVWVKRFDGRGDTEDGASDIVASADGSKVLVTGTSYRPSTQGDYATVAYDASTGSRLWARRYDGPIHGYEIAAALAASADGSLVVVTGSSYGVSSTIDYATVAYDGSTGARVWVKSYDGPGNSEDAASSVAATADGSIVFVTGTSYAVDSNYDYATIARDGATGRWLWIRRSSGPADGFDAASAVIVAPDGTKVFVTGGTYRGSDTGPDYRTLAFDSSSGTFLWSRYYDGDNRTDQAEAIAVSSDGSRVFVTGSSDSVTTGTDYATVAYAA